MIPILLQWQLAMLDILAGLIDLTPCDKLARKQAEILPFPKKIYPQHKGPVKRRGRKIKATSS